MKFLKKLIISMSMLFVGLSFHATRFVDNSVDNGNAVVAKAAGSSATLKDGIYNKEIPSLGDTINNNSLNSAIKTYNLSSLTITSNADYVKPNYIGPIDVGSTSTKKTNGCNIAAYFYVNAEDSTKFDAVFYANVDTIYAPEYCSGLFYSWSSLTTINFDNFNTSKTVSMSNMFIVCSGLTEIKGLDKFDTSKVTGMSGMFAHCANLTYLDLTGFDTSNVTDIDKMFEGCVRLKELDLSSMDLSKVTTGLDTMFYELTNKYDRELSVIYAPKEMGNNRILLPSYFTTEALNASLNPSTENKVILCANTTYKDPDNASITFTATNLANEVTNLNTCSDYAKAATYLARYNALSAEDKAKFDLVDSRKDNTTLINKLTYMVGLASTKTQNSPALSYSKMITKEVNYELIAIIALSVVSIFGYQFIQRRKYASK